MPAQMWAKCTLKPSTLLITVTATVTEANRFDGAGRGGEHHDGVECSYRCEPASAIQATMPPGRAAEGAGAERDNESCLFDRPVGDTHRTYREARAVKKFQI